MSRLVLVTGGAGFIGSHLVDALLARGDEVRVLDDFSTGRRENLAHCLADIELLEGDVRDKGLVTRAVARCDGVLHEAAVASVAQSLADPVRCGSITHGGTVNVLRLARRAGVGGFVLASSCAVYGDADALPIGEDTPPRPLSPYALAKLLSEEVCRPSPYAAEEGPSAAAQAMQTVCLRYFNVFGPRQDPSSEYSGVIARFMDVAVARDAAAARGGAGQGAGQGEEEGAEGGVTPQSREGGADGPRYVVYGDGRQSRDFVYVADVVAANLLALDACLASADRSAHIGGASGAHVGGASGTAMGGASGAGMAGASGADVGGASGADIDGAVLNIGSGTSVDVRTLAEMVEGLRLGAGKEGRQGVGEVEPPIEFRAPREGDIRASQADIARARRLLGYEPVTSFADGLAATYAWYAGHTAAGVS